MPVFWSTKIRKNENSINNKGTEYYTVPIKNAKQHTDRKKFREIMLRLR